MRRPNETGERLFVLFLLGGFLFNAPLVSIFDLPRQVFGIPLLYVYLFACWGVLLLLVAVIIEKSRDPEQPGDARDEGTGGDRNS